MGDTGIKKADNVVSVLSIDSVVRHSEGIWTYWVQWYELGHMLGIGLGRRGVQAKDLFSIFLAYGVALII